MVVEYDDGDAVLFENLDGLDVLRAAVDDDDEVAFALRYDLRDVLVQAVALIEAVRDENGCTIPAVDFPVRLLPVEYKHGKIRDESEYKIQLCAEAMCLEEMYHTTIPAGALFYITAHRRVDVELDEALREQVRQTVQKLWKVRREMLIPSAVYGPKCKRCSMQEYCMPKVKTSAKEYCKALLLEAERVETE